MTPEEVKLAWPDAYEAALQAIRKADDTYPAIPLLKRFEEIGLEQAKRIVLAIQNGLTLEE